MSTVVDRYPAAMLIYDGQSQQLSASQADPSAEFGLTPYQSRTLPRPARRGGSSAATSPSSNSRHRQYIISDYLKSLNSMTRSIVLEKEYVEERHAGEWKRMDETLQEEVVDDYFMPADVHAHYGTLPRASSRRSSCREPRSPSAASTLREERLSFRNLRVPSALSQPADSYTVPSSPTESYFIPPTHNRLHKNQLSYRSKALRKVMNIPPPNTTADPVHRQLEPHHQSNRDSGLGSDGESPRTSDEDHNPLGFQRNHLRSFSLRQKKGGGGRGHGSFSRSSTRRAPQRTAATGSEPRNSHSHPTRNQDGGDKGYDAEVDLPDDSLLHDYVTISSSTGTHGQKSPRSLPKPAKYSSRSRRSTRMIPRVLIEKLSTEDEEEEEDKEAIVIPNSISRVASNGSTSTVTSIFNDFDPSVPMYHSQPAMVFQNLRRAHSEDSIDTDTESIAQSNISNLSKSTGVLTEDDLLSEFAATPTPSCFTPDSMVSRHSRSGSRRELVRSRPQSRRGGSFLQTSTSEFADRRAQFKPNMLRNQLSSGQSTPTHTRPSTPSFSRQNTPGVTSPTPTHLDTPTSPHSQSLSPPSLPIKHRRSSASESTDTLGSPSGYTTPHTPLVKSISVRSPSRAPHNLHIRRGNKEQQRRESGYASSSSESFPFTAAQK